MSAPAAIDRPETPAPVPAAAPTRGFGWRYTSPLLTGSTLNPINSSLIATGLVGIGVDFHKGPGTTATLISVLYLCSAIMQPTTAWANTKPAAGTRTGVSRAAKEIAAVMFPSGSRMGAPMQQMVGNTSLLSTA